MPRKTDRADKPPLGKRLLRTLRDMQGVPTPTRDLVAMCAGDMPNARSQVWQALRILERAGVVRRKSRVKTREVDGDIRYHSTWVLARAG